jgi:hypothetical protein
MRPLIGALGLVLLLASSAWANSLAYSEAQLDWSGLQFTISEGLTVTAIQDGGRSSYASAFTTQGGFVSQYGSSWSAPLTWQTSTDGLATADASAANGLLTSTSLAGTTLFSSDLRNHGESTAETSTAFWLYGSGNGTLTVQIPYRLTIGLTETIPPSLNPYRYEVTSASANVFLLMGPGAIEGGWLAQSLTSSSTTGLLDGTLTNTGLFTMSRIFDNPYWGPLVSIIAETSTTATGRRYRNRRACSS